LLKEVEHQRNVLAILYQISLRCLMASDPDETEQLLTNVLRRLAPLDSGFIFYLNQGGWRVTICPGRARPAEQVVKAFYEMCALGREASIVTQAEELKSLGLDRGAALLLPLRLEQQLIGVMGATAIDPGAFTTATLDIVSQLANVAAAALGGRR
jgi:GAF domain-containing protein